jgi:hypothetical protein
MSANQYDPNKLGWGAAILTCAFTAALGFSAWTIHKNTYRHPRDPMAVQVYHDRDAAGHGPASSGEHGPADADHGGEHAAEPAKGAEAKH